jgi:uncharacterized membrane protein YeaQ/YmgE (transglycosylase-associated protein family)
MLLKCYWAGPDFDRLAAIIAAGRNRLRGGTMMTTMLATFFEQRVVVVEYQRSILGWIIIGLIAGWLAGKISRGEGYGCLTDIVLGLVGSLLGGWIFVRLGILGGGFIYSLAAATLGAFILVSIVHLIAGSRN